jgi:hypothetical protein
VYHADHRSTPRAIAQARAAERARGDVQVTLHVVESEDAPPPAGEAVQPVVEAAG